MLRFLVSVILGGAALFGSGYAIWDVAPAKVPPEYRPWEDISKYPEVVKAIADGEIKSAVYSNSPAFLTEDEKKAKSDKEAKEKADKEAALPKPDETKPEEKKPEEKKPEPKTDAAKPLRVQLVVHKEPVVMQEQLMFGGAQCLAAAFLLALIVKVAKLWSFVGRWFIAILIGLLIAVWSQGNEFIWFKYSREYAQFLAAYTAISFTVAGFFIAMGTGPSEHD